MNSNKILPYSRQTVIDSDIEAVIEVLRSDWLTQGPTVDRFEAAIADAVGAREVVAVSNGTAALHVAAMAAGLGPGKHLWTSPNTFVASANCALYCGAEVDFVDIDPQDGNMCMERLAEKLEKAERAHALPDVVVPVHFGGQACDMETLGALKQKYAFMVIEDACHAIGGSDRAGRPVGRCDVSDMSAFSFHPVKIVTTGEGGAVSTNDPDLATRLRLARSHGITRDPALIDGDLESPWAYRQIDVGYNYRLTDLQAALGISQLSRLKEFVERRNAFARRYDSLLEELPVTPLSVHRDAVSAYHLYVVRIDEQAAGQTRRQVFDALADRGIRCQVHYIPVHLQPVYQRLGFKPGDFPAAEDYYNVAITLPLFPSMTESDQDRVVDELRNIFLKKR